MSSTHELGDSYRLASLYEDLQTYNDLVLKPMSEAERAGNFGQFLQTENQFFQKLDGESEAERALTQQELRDFYAPRGNLVQLAQYVRQAAVVRLYGPRATEQAS